jgi:uncharacterized protein YcgL (UPF0745 family)
VHCYVYKSSSKAQTYVYLRERDATRVLPTELALALGELVFVMELELTPLRRLARLDVETLQNALSERGFHIQLPPGEWQLNPG